MNNFAGGFDQFLEFFSSTNLQLLLLIGSGILAVSLLVLALTRWGQSRPVWKCVILSFVAHILLIGYAYGTRLIFETPAVVREDSAPMRVNMIDEQGESLDGDDQADSSENSWDQFVNEQAMPAVEDLARPAIDSEVVIEKEEIDRSASEPEGIMQISELATPPQEFEEPEFADAPHQLASEFDANEKSVEPQAIEIERRGERGETQLELPAFDDPGEMARPEISDVATSAERSEKPRDTSIPKPNIDPFVSDLVDSKSDFPVAPESLPQPAPAPKFEHVKPARLLPQTPRRRSASNPRRIGDGQPLPKVYSLRNAVNRTEVAKQRGGSIETERAVELALKWLASNQEPDGSWSSSRPLAAAFTSSTRS